jgi:deoxyguanosine kinase
MIYQYVTIEGCIGSGKTSLSKMLAADFNARLILEQFENNPFLPRFYENPDRYAFPLELFFMAERYRQMKEFVVTPDLFYQSIISDYLFTKSLIFANITLKEDEHVLFRKLFQIINDQLPVPDLIMYLYNSIPNLLYNIAIRGRHYEQKIEANYLEKLQQAYLEYFRGQQHSVILVVDTSQLDFVSKREDYEKLKNLLTCRYEKGMHYIHF